VVLAHVTFSVWASYRDTQATRRIQRAGFHAHLQRTTDHGPAGGCAIACHPPRRPTLAADLATRIRCLKSPIADVDSGRQTPAKDTTRWYRHAIRGPAVSHAADGLEILLITSRETRRRIIPKGWLIRDLRPRDVAAREAFEEAGLVGKIVGKRSIGSYHYNKRLPDNYDRLYRVKVFCCRSITSSMTGRTRNSASSAGWTRSEAPGWWTRAGLPRSCVRLFRQSSCSIRGYANAGVCPDLRDPVSGCAGSR